MNMSNQLRAGLAATFVLAALTGLIYPAAITAVAQVLFPHQANGSLVEANGRVVGSELIGQTFTQPWYFHGRPSSAGNGYDASASNGSNKGPTDLELADTLIAGGVQQVATENDMPARNIPSDAVTRSGSGLDPHISPAYAELQVARVARARGSSEAQVRAIMRAHMEGRQFGFLGDPRVNVLLLNIDLDRRLPKR